MKIYAEDIYRRCILGISIAKTKATVEGYPQFSLLDLSQSRE